MWQTEFSLEINTKNEKIWTLWQDVKNWNKWNVGIEYSNINGKFENGTYGSFKTINGKKSIFLCFVLKNCIPNKSFISRVKLMFCTIDLGHEIIECANTIKIKHYIKMNGILTFYYKKTIGKHLSKTLEKSVKKLIEVAGG